MPVLNVIAETADACSIVLGVPEELRGRFTYRPGQFLTVRIPDGEGAGAARCYSLSSAPGADPTLRITVKRVKGGYGSNWLCDHVRPGDTLEVLPPSGRFTPDSLEADLLLFAAGSGITPVISIVNALLAGSAGSAVLFYANRDEASVIFAGELRDLAASAPDRLQVVHLLESLQGLPTVASLAALAAPHAARDAAFICGPAPFMDAVGEALGSLGMGRERIVMERFHSLSGDPFAAVENIPEESGAADSAQLKVALNGDEHLLEWPTKISLLALLRARGLQPPFSCEEGFCGACACRVLAGETKMLCNDVLEDEDLEEGLVLSCQALPMSDEVEVTFD
ncbi:ferredoxin--NADP reductase [Actinomadura rudentiformis]|uniref:Ferredoxin--NADP reductase n=1 Tax=Actinomadura rudentiformis TaxID=359158 RepID=A0A6H9YMM2_9ACTN|nr:ferredoxin--NADP reductase [Actinomadura rudentiformis]